MFEAKNFTRRKGERTISTSRKEVQSLCSRLIIEHGEKENILGYFTQRHKDRISSTLRKDAQSRFLALSIDFTKKKVEKIKN